MINMKQEAAILKIGFDYFCSTILKTLGIDYDFVEIDSIDPMGLTMQPLGMQFTFLTMEDFYIHIEFKTMDSEEKDLRRFHAYEGVFSERTGKNVITYVIYFGGTEHAITEIDCGKYFYRVIPIYLTEKDADSILKRLQKKQQKGEVFSEEDFVQLALAPLIKSKKNRKDVILESLELSKMETSTTAEKTMAMLYILADKFLTDMDSVWVKEKVETTRIEQMMFVAGVTRGREFARQEQMTLMSTLVSRLLKEKRLDDIQRMVEDEEYTEQLMKEFNIS